MNGKKLVELSDERLRAMDPNTLKEYMTEFLQWQFKYATRISRIIAENDRKDVQKMLEPKLQGKGEK